MKEVFTSENYIRYLETFSKFHNYSFNNTILILMQCPKASFVASYKDWTEKFNRIVKKGSKGIQILVPTPKKIWEEEECTRPDGSKYKGRSKSVSSTLKLDTFSIWAKQLVMNCRGLHRIWNLIHQNWISCLILYSQHQRFRSVTITTSKQTQIQMAIIVLLKKRYV